uniref:MitMem_reg domain-containing protein n=1 Tax=Syphacia muris TaxID=451379 RepID=A0A0N5AIR8_9BILA
MDAFPGENVALSLIQSGTTSKQRETSLETGLEQLERSTAEMLVWLQKLLAYVNQVLKQPELPADSSMGRRMMDVVTTAASYMSEDKLDSLVKNSLRDYMMFAYLANLTKTQLTLQERLIEL